MEEANKNKQFRSFAFFLLIQRVENTKYERKQNRGFVYGQHINFYYMFGRCVTILHAYIIFQFKLKMFYIRVTIWIVSVETQNNYE